jgi:uncharacterized protein HemX
LTVAAVASGGLGTQAARAVGGGSAFSELTSGGREKGAGAGTPSKGAAAPNGTARSNRTARSNGTEEGGTEPKASTTTSNSKSTGLLLLGLIAAGALIAGIAFMILRDARRVAPVPDGQLTAQGRPARDMAAMMRKRRAKAKAARRQRKRNR